MVVVVVVVVTLAVLAVAYIVDFCVYGCLVVCRQEKWKPVD